MASKPFEARNATSRPLPQPMSAVRPPGGRSAAPAREGRPAAAARASRAQSPQRRCRKRQEFSIHAGPDVAGSRSLKNSAAKAPRTLALNSGARAGPPYPFFRPSEREVGAPGGAGERAELPDRLCESRSTPRFRDHSALRGGGGSRGVGPLRGARRLPALQRDASCRAPHPAPASNAAIDGFRRKNKTGTFRGPAELESTRRAAFRRDFGWARVPAVTQRALRAVGSTG